MKKTFLFIIFLMLALPQASFSENISRDWNSNTQTINGISTAEFHQKWINWLDTDGFKPIDSSFVATVKGFEMVNAPFKVYLPKTADGVASMVNDNRFNVVNKTKITEPPLIMNISANGVTPVLGKTVTGDLVVPSGLQKNVPYVIYEGAYPDADLIYYVDFGLAPRLEKLIKFNHKPLNLSYSFNIKYSSTVDFKRDVSGIKQKWTKATTLDVPKGKPLLINIATSTVRGMGFKQFQIWDSNVTGKVRNIQPITVNITPQTANSYTLTKILPATFFATATYPVYTDTTTTFFPDPNVEVSSVDGYASSFEGNPGASWATMKGRSGDDSRDTGANENKPDIDSGTGVNAYNEIGRMIFLFDTSSITSANSVSAATMSVSGGGASNDNYSQSVNVVESAPASNTAIVNADYGTFPGSSGSMTTLSSAVTVTAWNIATYNDFALNGTGISKVSVTGVTKLGLAFSADYTNTEVTWSSNVTASVNSVCAETALTISDPKLVVTYATASVAVISRYIDELISFTE